MPPEAFSSKQLPSPFVFFPRFSRSSKLYHTTIAGGILVDEICYFLRRDDIDFWQDRWIPDSSQEGHKCDEVFLSSFFPIVNRPMGGSSKSFYINRNQIASVSRHRRISYCRA